MGKTFHFKNLSVVKGDTKVNINLDRFSDQFKRAQYWLDSQVMNDMDPLMPHVDGTFINLTRARSAALAGSGQVVAAAPPYGRFLYYGKVMVDPETGSPFARKDAKKVLVSEFGGKTNAKENLTYSNPNAVPEWFEAAKKQHLSQWVDGVKEIAGGGDG